MGIRDLPWAKRSGNNFFIPHDRIKPGPWGNVRTEFPEESVEQRANSLILEGQKQPVEGFLSEDEEYFLLIDGEVRWKAWEYAKSTLNVDLDDKLGGMLCMVGEKVGGKIPDEKEIKYRQLGYGTDTILLSKADQAKAVSELNKTDSVSEIARRLCCTPQHVRDLIAFVNAPEHLKKAVENRQMKITTAVKTVRATKAAQEEIRDQVEQGRKVSGKDVDLANFTNPDETDSEQEEVVIEEAVMTREEISAQIKKADIRFFKARSEKEKIKWMSFKEAFRIVLKLAEPLS